MFYNDKETCLYFCGARLFNVSMSPFLFSWKLIDKGVHNSYSEIIIMEKSRV